MGVTNLWALLEPCGRRIDVEALRGKKLAVDASGWVFRFIKAMRDENGELIPNAHLIGFFRRICKLLFYNIRPVFIFDGSTPALKRQTVVERRRRREQQEARVKKTAEKLLLNRLKQNLLAETMQRKKVHTNDQMNKRADALTSDEQRQLMHLATTTIPTNNNPFQPSSSSQLDPIRIGNDTTDGQSLIVDLVQEPPKQSPQNSDVDDDDDDENVIDFESFLPEDDSSNEGNMMGIDPVVLSTLPPSIQLEMMLRLRERQMAANRAQFEERTGKPEEFSRYQILQYLKSSTLRRQLDTIRGTNGGGTAVPRPVVAQEETEYVLEKTEEPRTDDFCPQEQGNTVEGDLMTTIEKNKTPTSGSLHVTTGGDTTTTTAPSTFTLSFQVTNDEVESDDDLDWEDIDDNVDDEGGLDGDETALTGTKATTKQHWRERAAGRQKYWSLSHGFQMGRKLAQWGEKDTTNNTTKKPEHHLKEPTREEVQDIDEDAQLQEAIRRSLLEETPSKEEARTVSDMTTLHNDDDDDNVPVAVQCTAGREECVQQDGTATLSIGNAADDDNGDDARDVPLNNNNIPEPEYFPTTTPRGYKIDPQNDGNNIFTQISVPKFKGQKQPPKLDVSLNATAARTKEDTPASDHADTDERKATPLNVFTSVACSDNNHGARPQPMTAITQVEELKKAQGVGGISQSTKKCADDVDGSPTQILLPETLENDPQQSSPPSWPDDEIVKRKKVVRFEDTPGSRQITPSSLPPLPPVMKSEGVEVHGNDITQADNSELRTIVSQKPLVEYQPQMNSVKATAAAATAVQDDQTLEGLLTWTAQSHQFMVDDIELLDQEELEREEDMLRAEQRAAAGQSDNPTDQMFAECQELLQLFGIPYIIAPSEAEAQAAWLDGAGLVDGVVTDDNDAFLFGARRVYRNIFEGTKYVEEYRTSDIESELGFTRERLVTMALLLGSDYTPGVAGVGVVNAVELIRTFGDGYQGMLKFAKWMKSLDEDLVKLAKSAVSGGDKKDNPVDDDTVEEESDVLRNFKRKHKNVRKTWNLPVGFPSNDVIKAYIEAKVDDSKEKFSFIRPDPALLRQFCSNKFGWDYSKTDELLNPVLQAYDERQTQQTLDSFVSYRQRFAKIRSKRLREAVVGINNNVNKHLLLVEDKDGDEAGEIEKEEERKPTKKRKQGGNSSISKNLNNTNKKTKKKM